jgi:hypothetical protein
MAKTVADQFAEILVAGVKRIYAIVALVFIFARRPRMATIWLRCSPGDVCSIRCGWVTPRRPRKRPSEFGGPRGLRDCCACAGVCSGRFDAAAGSLRFEIAASTFLDRKIIQETRFRA